MGMTFVVAGGSGLVGQIIVESLESKGLEPYVIESYRNLSSKQISDSYPPGPKTLINCTGVTPSSFHLSKSNYVNDNIGSVLKLLISTKEQNFKSFFHVSTSYLNDFDPRDSYMRSKKEAEELVSIFSISLNLKSTIIRVPNIWTSSEKNHSRLFLHLLNQHPNYSMFGIQNPNFELNLISKKSFLKAAIPLILNQANTSETEFINGWQGTVKELVQQLKSGPTTGEMPLLKNIIEEVSKFR